MKITSINAFCILRQPQKLASKPKIFNKNNEANFCGSFIFPSQYDVEIQKEKEERFFQDFLNKKGKVTTKEYKEIAKRHPSAILKADAYVTKNTKTNSTPKQVAKAAIVLKEKYDKEYGKNYTIISIGTSPAIIAETMQALGCKIIFLPASSLKSIEKSPMYIFRNQYPTIASRIPNVDRMVSYIRKNGITERTNDHILLLDLCDSRKSISNLERILKEEGIGKKDNLHIHSITEDLAELTNFDNKNSILGVQDFKNIAEDMIKSIIETISNVPHFDVDNHVNDKYPEDHISSSHKTYRQTFREFDNYSQPLARAFALCSIHEAMKLM